MGASEDELEDELAMLGLYLFICEVITDLAQPKPICQCLMPTVGNPDEMDWCTCHACQRAVAMTDVVAHRATIQ